MPTSEELRLAGWTQVADLWTPPVATEAKTRILRELRKGFKGSPIERRFAAAWHWHFGGYPRSQVCIPRNEGGHFCVDFLLPIALVVELDGHDWHSNQVQRTKDAQRDRELMRYGYRVIRFTGSEIVADPDACVLEAAGMAGMR